MEVAYKLLSKEKNLKFPERLRRLSFPLVPAQRVAYKRGLLTNGFRVENPKKKLLINAELLIVDG